MLFYWMNSVLPGYVFLEVAIAIYVRVPDLYTSILRVPKATQTYSVDSLVRPNPTSPSYLDY